MQASNIDVMAEPSDTGSERHVGSSATCLGSETLAGLAVASTVRWRSIGGQFQTLTAEERLYDWR